MKIEEREYYQNLGDHSQRYWKNGSTKILVYPELADPDSAKPFIVRLRGEHYIPINELVYGANEDEARERLLAAMHWCAEHDDHNETNTYMKHRDIRHLKELEAGTMWFEIEPLDITSIVSVDWCA